MADPFPDPWPEIRLLLPPEHFVRPKWTLEVGGLDGCRELLGALGRA